ncbi:MAG: hypothetical protein BGN88_08055 [Clostridiales bacterium 43-6]|nr:MAG: hypothetical protein BGN88_08055 [Clostridiales bacterium 43-6]
MKNKLYSFLLVAAILVSGMLGNMSLVSALAGNNEGDGKFTIAVIPDTQQEVLPNTTALTNKIFKNRTQWLVNHKDELDLRFVAHTGDVINGNPTDNSYIKVASEAMQVLDDSGIPNALALGGIDTAAVLPGGSAAPGQTNVLVRDTSVFNTFFPTTRYPGIETFEPNKIDNSYQTFTAEGTKWLMLTLEVWPRTEAINWAKGVVASHPDYNVIINTHEFLDSKNVISTSSGYGSNTPVYLFDNLVKVYPNIRFVLCGNNNSTKAGSRADKGVNGNTIISIRGCFQSSTNNPVQLLEIDVKNGTANSRFYAPFDGYTWNEYTKTFSGLSFEAITVESVIAKIDALPANITLASKSAVQAARAAYNMLTTAQMLLVTNSNRLTDAEKVIADLSAEVKFTIAVIPDTQQELTISDAINREFFKNRTNWLVANRESLDLRMVIQTGDLVNWDTPMHEQYELGSAAMKVLDDAKIPNAVTIGNHDTAAVGVGGSAADPTNTKTLVRNTTTFNTYFPVSRYPGIVTFEPNKVDNAYRTFTASGKNWLVLTLELWPRAEVVNWAKTVVASHPFYNVIVSTHSYLDGSGNIYQKSDYGETSPQYLYDNLIKLYPNIKMVLCGHTGVAGSRVDTGVNGNKIVTVLGCFHSNSNNPVQLLEIDTYDNSVSTRAFAPLDGYVWNEYKKTFDQMNFVDPIDKSQLKSTIDNAQLLLNDAVTGTHPGNYPQSSIDELQGAINAAVAVYNDEMADGTAVATVNSALTGAVDTFKSKFQPHTAAISIDSETVYVENDNIIKATVTVKDVKDTNVFRANVEYDPAVLEIVETKILVDDAVFSQTSEHNGVITILIGTKEYHSYSSKNIVEITFKVRKNESAVTHIGLSKVESAIQSGENAEDILIPITQNDCLLTIKTVKELCDLNHDSVITLADLSLALANYQKTGAGDANLDGIVDTADYIIIAGYLVG